MMTNRRGLLLGAGGAAALGLMPQSALALGKRKLDAIGIQLFTVRDIFAKDPVGTLEQIAKIGFKEIEFGGGGYEGMDHSLLRATMDRLGLRTPSIHISYEALLNNFDRAMQMAKTLGTETIVLPWMADKYLNEVEWNKAIPNINRFAADVKKLGYGFAYHNHDFEFTNKPGGVSLMDRLLRESDPALVKIELDIFWTARAGEDVAAWIDRLSNRLYSYHVKDMTANKTMAAVGEGTIDFASLFARKSSANVRHFYVENDMAPAPYFPDITTSYQTLRAMRF